MAENKGEGYQAIGRRFASKKTFNRAALYIGLSGLQVERVTESRLEIIATKTERTWQAQLMAYLAHSS